MTWSLVQSFTTTATSLNKADLSAPHTYFFETFLPTRGWTVTADETGGGSYNNTSEGMWGISKDFTFADGSVVNRSHIIELEYTFSDALVYDWTGVAGEGRGTNRLSDTSWDHGIKTGSVNYHILASDENQDAFCMFGNKSLIYYSWPSTGIYLSNVLDSEKLYSLGNLVCIDSSGVGSSLHYQGFGQSFYKTSYMLTSAFGLYTNVNGSGAYGQNVVPDTFSRMTNTTTAYGRIDGSNPSSVLIDGDYYLDMYPASDQSLLLKTGATDLGVLS